MHNTRMTSLLGGFVAFIFCVHPSVPRFLLRKGFGHRYATFSHAFFVCGVIAAGLFLRHTFAYPIRLMLLPIEALDLTPPYYWPAYDRSILEGGSTHWRAVDPFLRLSVLGVPLALAALLAFRHAGSAWWRARAKPSAVHSRFVGDSRVGGWVIEVPLLVLGGYLIALYEPVTGTYLVACGVVLAIDEFAIARGYSNQVQTVRDQLREQRRIERDLGSWGT